MLSQRPLTVAVPKGRLLPRIATLLSQVGIDASSVDEASRRLTFDLPSQNLRFILAKPSDVPILVEYGAADVGIAGRDVLLEADMEVCELLDLGIGRCRMVVASPVGRGITRIDQLSFTSRVATKYPHITVEFFRQHGIQAEVIKMNGNIEVAPMVGLADVIVDITETGTTLRENGLVEIGKLFDITSRLIANRVSYKLEYSRIRTMADDLADVIKRRACDTARSDALT